MFCKNCGNKGTGRYCSNCGASLVEEKVKTYKSVEPLQHHPKFEGLMLEARRHSTKSTVGTNSLKAVDRLMSTALSMDIIIPLESGDISNYLMKKLGFKSTHVDNRSYYINYPYTFTAISYYLIKNSIEIIEPITESDSVCKFDGAIPGNWLTWGGKIRIAIHNQPTMVTVYAETEFGGQIIDWGRGSATINSLFDFIETKTYEFTKSDL